MGYPQILAVFPLLSTIYHLFSFYPTSNTKSTTINQLIFCFRYCQKYRQNKEKQPLINFYKGLFFHSLSTTRFQKLLHFHFANFSL